MAVTSEHSPKVAFLGLGAMGFAMSTHLVRQGISVTGFDIWKPTLQRFEDACKLIPNAVFGTTTSATEAVKSASIIVLMVATHHHVNAALFDAQNPAVKSVPHDATVIITATVPPMYPAEVRKRLDDEFSRPDIKLIDAPVSGGTVRSANGTLTIMSSSDDPSALTNSDVQIVLSNLSSEGKTLFMIPGSLGAGTSAKALNQVQCGIHIVSGSEIMALAALNGLNTSTFYDNMKAPDPTSNKPRYGWTWMFENRGPRMLDPNLPISSATSIINKDVGIIKDEEDRLSVELPLLNKAHAVLSDAMAVDMASVDDAWLNRLYLGLGSSRELLAVSQTQSQSQSSVNTANEELKKTDILLLAHSLINFQSAYETFSFAEALDLRGETQRQMWFTIIAGAAGGSRVFSEVIPAAFEAVSQGQKWTYGFQQYARKVFGQHFGSDKMTDVEKIIIDANTAGVKPVLLETALGFVRGQMN